MNSKLKFLNDILWGAAIADAIGNPLEFKAKVTTADFNKSVDAAALHISDDTQMSLFLYEALHSKSPPEDYLRRWYITQTTSQKIRGTKHGLLQFDSLYRVEAPGATCMSACRSLYIGSPVKNDSKGNGTVMRASPIAAYAILKDLAPAQAYLMAQADALLTHRHPYAWQSSVMLVDLHLGLYRGEPLQVAVMNSHKELTSCKDVTSLVAGMLNEDAYLTLKCSRCGWIAEEALALAVGACLHEEHYMSRIKAACQGESCDSDTVAGIAGGLSAAMGDGAPGHLQAKVAAADAIEYIINLYATKQE